MQLIDFDSKQYDRAGFHLTNLEIATFLIFNPIWLRYFFKWRHSLHLKKKNPEVTALDLGIPWITYGAIEYISEHLKKSDRVFEYGTGGSTIFFSKKTKQVISIEHDKMWHDVTRKNIINENVIFKLSLPKRNNNVKQYSHRSYSSINSNQYKNKSFKTYVLEITKYPKGYFDLVLVDGRSRASCLFVCMNYVKGGGFIVLDNSERREYSETMSILDKKYKRIDFTGFGPLLNTFWRTSIWQVI